MSKVFHSTYFQCVPIQLLFMLPLASIPVFITPFITICGLYFILIDPF